MKSLIHPLTDLEDGFFAPHHHQTDQEPDQSPASVFQGRVQEPHLERPVSVSYTHLTLPTIVGV